jgi:protein transport protein SEC13
VEIVRQFVSGGGDNIIKIWTYEVEEGRFNVEEIGAHSDWVRDVAWAPSIGTTVQTIASCGEDKTVYIWTKEGNQRWSYRDLTDEKFTVPVWRVSWSVAGNLLAVSAGDNVARVYKENTDGLWEQVSNVNSGGMLESVE